VNPYAMLARSSDDHQRRFLEELRNWHDEMVLHQRSVRRLGTRACSDGCPHADGRRLWREARTVLGAAADSLTFLRACAADDAQGPQAAPASPATPA